MKDTVISPAMTPPDISEPDRADGRGALKPSAGGTALHHVGIVVASIDAVGDAFASLLGAEWDREIVHDPLQHARVTFMRCRRDSTAIELVEPDDDASPLHRSLSRGGGLHHLCYEVDALDSQLQSCRSAGALVVRPPLPATAFGGRRIAWVYSQQKLLVEYLER
jgi:methylmalonyl-CoA/ethylmalonyl-CoA epimerase